MADEGLTGQSLSDKKHQFYGSSRNYFDRTLYNSGTAFTYIDFSGTYTGFGLANNVLSNHIHIKTSGATTDGIFTQWKFVSGATTPIDGALDSTDNIYLDGVNRSGLWIRVNTNATRVWIWAW